MNEQQFAKRAWRLIQLKPVSITIRRGQTLLSPQTVRVEYSNYNRPAEGTSGAVSVKRDVIVFGVSNHPDEDVADTDIQKGDVFVYQGQSLKVIDVVITQGNPQAHCEAYT